MTPDLFYDKVPEILIADDTIESLRMISQALSSHGYDVRSVTNGTLALASAKEAQPDLILLDIRMPDLSGYEVCRELKENPLTQEIPVIFISALQETIDKVEAFAVGGVDYLTKPLHLPEVLARIQAQLAWRFSLKEIQKLNQQLDKRVQQRTAELAWSNQSLKEEILERKKIEESLRESESKFRQLSENIQEVFWLTDYDPQLGKVTNMDYVSPAFETVWGHTCESLYHNPWLWIEVIYPDDRQRVKTSFKQNAVEGSFDEEYRIIRPDGSIRWIHDRGFPIYNEDGQVYRIAGIAEDITKRKLTQEALRESEARWQFALEGAGDGIWDWNIETNSVFFSAQLKAMLGYTDQEMSNHLEEWKSRIHREDIDSVFEDVDKYFKGEISVYENEHRLLCKDGSYKWILDRGKVIEWTAEGKPLRMIGIHSDITRRKQAELERDRFFNLSLDLLFIADYQGTLKRINPAWSNLLGYSEQNLLNQSLLQIIHPDDQSTVEDALQRLNQGKDIDILEIRCRCLDESYLWIAWNAVPFPQENLLYGAGRNISQRKASEERLVHQTLHDSLTGLANRSYFMERLELAIKKEKRHPNQHLAVLFIDLDDFKHINDTLGHFIGDQFLIEVAQILRTSVRDVDCVARLGGDEFIILLEEVYYQENVFKIVQRIQEKLKSSIQLREYNILTSASIGIFLDTEDYQDINEIVRNADIAMYQAKAKGKGCYELYNHTMYCQTLHRVELENALRNAIANQELYLYYQPILNLQDNLKLEGFEILLRWHHQEKGLIAASEFIPLAEETGEINVIGEWVLHEACSQFQHWCGIYPDFEQLYFSINISGRQLRDISLVTILEQNLKESQIPPHCLKLEITETSLIENTTIAVKILQKIQDLGVQISLDDFGTGFSSLRYLHQFPLNVIKIDRSFVQTLNQGSRERSIIASIIALARALDFTTVAEGIETPQQLEQLQTLGCQSGQGYFFSKPNQLPELLRQYFV
ncbi:MAG: EAL domain-containing protein [Crocosphaera sp.]|nr:EAL domain-containing protein [Crocosphaera sp.]